MMINALWVDIYPSLVLLMRVHTADRLFFLLNSQLTLIYESHMKSIQGFSFGCLKINRRKKTK